MGFATDITSDEAMLGFELVEHGRFGAIATVRVGNGLRAVKMREGERVVYAIYDDALVMLYPTAGSLFDLRRRFGVGDERAV